MPIKEYRYGDVMPWGASVTRKVFYTDDLSNPRDYESLAQSIPGEFPYLIVGIVNHELPRFFYSNTATHAALKQATESEVGSLEPDEWIPGQIYVGANYKLTSLNLHKKPSEDRTRSELLVRRLLRGISSSLYDSKFMVCMVVRGFPIPPTTHQYIPTLGRLKLVKDVWGSDRT